MNLEDYFDFLAPDDIRIKGHRIGIETVLYEYIHRAQTPEAIRERYPSLTLEEVYATVLYYLHHRERVHAYLTDWLNYCREAETAFDADPPPGVERLRRLREAREAAGAASLVEAPIAEAA